MWMITSKVARRILCPAVCIVLSTRLVNAVMNPNQSNQYYQTNYKYNYKHEEIVRIIIDLA